jgi:RNA polymerase sigma-70 factor (ECF subfamily)
MTILGGPMYANRASFPGGIALMFDSSRIAEASLVPRLQRGDGAAFEELVRAHGPRLLRVARRMMRSEEDTRDAVQDAFVSAFRSIGKFEAGSQLATWLHRIVINACLMKLRTQRRHPEEDLEDYLPRFQEDGHQVERSVAWCEPADTLVERAQTRELVRRSIDRLPDTYRVVLLLRDIEELPADEVAQMLGVTTNAVKIRLHRARQALRTILDPHMREVK